MRVRIGPYIDACRKALGEAMNLLKSMAPPAAHTRLQVYSVGRGAAYYVRAPRQGAGSAHARILR